MSVGQNLVNLGIAGGAVDPADEKAANARHASLAQMTGTGNAGMWDRMAGPKELRLHRERLRCAGWGQMRCLQNSSGDIAGNDRGAIKAATDRAAAQECLQNRPRILAS